MATDADLTTLWRDIRDLTDVLSAKIDQIRGEPSPALILQVAAINAELTSTLSAAVLLLIERVEGP